MSGFAGIINFSAKIQDDNNFMLMVNELVSHPHKATSSFSNNHAKIFHAELNFKEASSKQNSIFYCSMSEKLVLFYGRIDNKDEISLITKERHLEAKQCFILHKLHKEKFHKYLQGSWVLVIIDFVNKTLISYKDHIGSKPFFFIK